MNILVTGGSRGIGRAICVALAAPGRTILINYLRNDTAAEETAAMVRERGAEALVVQANVRSESDLKVLAEAMNPVDVLVHNAAVGALRPFDKMRTNHWDLTIESSLRPFWLLTKLVTTLLVTLVLSLTLTLTLTGRSGSTCWTGSSHAPPLESASFSSALQWG